VKILIPLIALSGAILALATDVSARALAYL